MRWRGYANRFVLANFRFAMFRSFAAASICPERKQESLPSKLSCCLANNWLGLAKDHFMLLLSPSLTAVIGSLHGPLRKEVGAVPSPQSVRLCRACCNG